MTDDFFRNRLDQMIDLRHPLAVLANRMPWQEIEASLAHRWARQVKAGKNIEDLDLFGPVTAVAGGGVSNAGRPRLPTRLMVALLYLKHAFNESDEDVIQRWGETPTWQYFSGNEYFEHQWPCDPTQLGRFRKALGEEGVEELLARTMEVAVTLKLIAKKELTRVIVDSTVQVTAVAMGQGGDVFVLDMGQPVKIIDLARRMVELSGLTVRDELNPSGDIELVMTGLRPGEKLYEELLIGDNPKPTQHPRIMKAHEQYLSRAQLEGKLNALKIAMSVNDVPVIRGQLQELVSGYQPSGEVVDWVHMAQEREALANGT